MTRANRICALILVLGSLAASNAFASRARQLVMGSADPLGVLTGTAGTGHGSFFYDDNYNIFYNPSYVNDFKNWASVEKSNGAGEAEGGFVASITSFNFGFYMNRADAVQAPVGGFAAGNKPLRPFDLFLGADMGVKWGVGFSYGNHSGPDPLSASNATIHLGAQIADLEPFGTVIVKGSNKTAGGEDKFSGFNLGTRYKWGEWVPFAAVAQFSNTSAAGADTKSTSYGLGVGRNAKIAEGTHLNYSLAFWRNTQAKRSVLPLDMSLEGDIATWLTARAGFSHRLMDRADGVTTTAGAATTGRLGATIHMGKVNFDWAAGSTAGAEALDGATIDLANGFFTAANLTYRW